MPNIEIKATCSDLKTARLVANQLKTDYLGIDEQIDTYFITQNGRFKLRESSLSGSYLIPYVRENSAGPKKSDYLKINVDNSEKTKELFINLLGLKNVVKKTREIFLINNVRVHLDQVDNLGSFIEFEAVYENPQDEEMETEKVEELIKKFNIKSSDLMTNSYLEIKK